MEGDLLTHFIRFSDNGYSENICKYILKEVLKVIDFLHTKNVIHRDIRAMNILFNQQGDVKLGDFGIAV